MSFVDTKYIGLVSVRLQKFSKKKEGLYTFRCPYCGDSQKNKNKTRGYLYQFKNDHNFKCHNCGVSRSFTNFLKDQDAMLHDQYIMERYKSGLTGKGTTTPNPVVKSSKPKFVKKDFDLPRISELNKEHPAKAYLTTRNLPDKCLRDLYYCDKFKAWTNEQKQSFDNIDNDEPRIIIPLRNRDGIVGFQGRALNPKSKLRYITIMLNEEAPKVYGMDRIDKEETVYVVEGPFDSTFIKNCVSLCGSDGSLACLEGSDKVFVYDNEARNKDIVGRIEKCINRGERVVIWPKNIKEKDINDMFLAGHDVQTVVELNTYSSIEATIKLTDWKRV